MSGPHGVLAAFCEPEPLTAAAADLRRQGFAELDAFTPYPVPELDDILGATAGPLPWIVLAGGVFGAAAAYGLILYSVLIDYPINVGGRPLDAWPAFLVLAFEGGILGAALAAFIGMLALNRLPTYHHPVFDAASFTFARDDRFYLLVRGGDPRFAEPSLAEHLRAAGAVSVETIPA
jgi:hypothetical protein